MPHEIRPVPIADFPSAREELKKTHYPIIPGRTFGSGMRSRTAEDLLRAADQLFPSAVLELHGVGRGGRTPLPREFFVEREKAKPLLSLTDGELSMLAELRPRPVSRREFLALLAKHGVSPPEPGKKFLPNYLSRLNCELKREAGWGWTITSVRSQPGNVHYAVSSEAGDHFGFAPPTDLRHIYSNTRRQLIGYFDTHDDATSTELEKHVGYGRRGATTPAARVRRDMLDLNRDYTRLLGYPLVVIRRLGKGGVNSPLHFCVNPAARGLPPQSDASPKLPSSPKKAVYGKPGEVLDTLTANLGFSTSELAELLNCTPHGVAAYLTALNSMTIAGIQPPHVLSGTRARKLGRRHLTSHALLNLFGKTMPKDPVYMLLSDRARVHYPRIRSGKLRPEHFEPFSPKTHSNEQDALREVQNVRKIIKEAQAAARAARLRAGKPGAPKPQGAQRKGYSRDLDAILNGKDDLFS